MSRGQEWRYYLCRECGKYSVPATEAEAIVLRHVRELVLPREAVEEARELLRARLALPSRGLVNESRAKIEKRLQQLKKLVEWSEIDDAEYLAKANAARAELALLPDHDKIRSFDEVAGLVASLPAALHAATPDQVKQLIAMVVDEVTTKDRVVHEIRLRPEAMPFFASPDPVLALAPPDGLEPPTRSLGRCRSIH